MKTVAHSLAWSAVAAFLAVAGAAPLSAQSIVAAPAATPGPARTAASATGTAASNFASALASDAPLLKRGPVTVRPHLEYRALYGKGVEAGPGNPRDTTIQSVSPGVLFEVGKYWHLDYSPTWTFYSNEAFRDTADQAATLAGRVPHPRGTLGITQSYESSHALLVETGRQTHQEKLATLLEATYRLGRHTLLETGASRNVRYANAVTDAPEWTTSDWVQWSSSTWLHYEFTPRLSASVGFTLGYAQVGVGADMTSTQPQLKVAWRPSDKLTFAAQGGQESRRFEKDASPDLESPVYSASGSYQLLPTTKFSVSATRSVSASYFANEVTKNRGWTIGMEQRLLQRLYLATDLVEQETDYVGVRAGTRAPRADRYRAVNVRLTTVLLHHITLALVYQTGRNFSDDAAYAFHSNQYGIEASVRF